MKIKKKILSGAEGKGGGRGWGGARVRDFFTKIQI